MATIGTLVVDAVMRTNKLQRGAGIARKEITSVSNVSRSVGQSMTGLVTKVGAVGAAFLSAAKFVSEFNQQANALDRLAKHSSTIGLTAQQLRALRENAELSGISAASLDNNMQRFARRLSEAASGTGSAAKAFKELGLNAQELEGMGLHEAFLSVADSVKGTGGELDKVRIAFALFGREGVDMIRILNQGSEGIKEQERAFEKYAGVIGEDGLQAVQDMNDAWQKLMTSMGGTMAELVASMAPFLKELFESLKEVWQVVRDITGAFSSFLDKVAEFLGIDIKARVDEQNKSFEKHTSTVVALTEAEKRATEAAKERQRQIDAMMSRGAKLTKQFQTPMQAFRAEVMDLNKLVGVGAIKWGVYEKAVKAAQKKVLDSNKSVSNASRTVGAMTRGSSAAFSALNAAKRQFEETKRIDMERNAKLADIRRILTDIRANQDADNGKIEIVTNNL